MIYREKTVESEYIYRGKILNLRKDLVELPNGRTAEREIVEHYGGVCILPVDNEGRIILVRQFRKAYENDLLEIPAGKIDKGEEPLKYGIRELREETGCTADKMIDLGFILPTPGYTEERIYLYLALGLRQGVQNLDENEFLDLERYSVQEVMDMCKNGQIIDAKTIVAVFRAREYLEKL